MFPPEWQKTVALYHLPVTAGNTQPYPGSADVTTTGAFLPMDTKQHVVEGEDLVNPHELYLDPTVDVRVGDKCVIDSVTYYIKKCFVGYAGGLKHIRCAVSSES